MSQAQYDPRRLVGVNAERVTDVSSTDFPGHYPNEDHSWNMDKFLKNFKVKVMRLSNRSVEFDLIGVDASIANAFRRIMIAEVPTICVEHVYVHQNTSIVQDEVLAHRIGLVPLNVHPKLLEWKGENDPATDQNTIVFEMNMSCKRKPNPAPGAKEPEDIYIDHELLSSHMVWKPSGDQGNMQEFLDVPPAPINPNIVLAKLRPGQEVRITLHANLGIGSDHAKFSPVATASYRLLPHIHIKSPIPPHLASKFQKCFSPGVIKINPQTKSVSVDPDGVRKDSVSREVLRHPEFEDIVELSRVRDHFLFNVESESAYPPEEIFLASVDVMRSKIKSIKAAAEAIKASMDGDVVMAG